MKRVIGLAGIVAIALSGLAACSRTEPSASVAKPQAEAAPKVQVDLSTPDRALKSYWAVRDAVSARNHEFVKSEAVVRANAEDKTQYLTVADEALTKAFTEHANVLETFARDIMDVKVESESRAVITARIKNNTPIPAGATVTKYDEERRANGDRYRYVLEKTQSGWRVAEIWEWDEFGRKAEWKKMQPRDEGPYVPTIAMIGI